MEITFDLDELTIGELCDFEEISGMTGREVQATGALTAKGILAVIYIYGRRDNPAYTLDDARQVKPKELTVADTANPTPAAPVTPMNRPAKRQRASA